MDHSVSHYGHRPPSQLSWTQTTHSAFLDRHRSPSQPFWMDHPVNYPEHRPPSQPTWTKHIQLVVYLDTDHHQLGSKSMQPKPWKVRPIFWWMFNLIIVYFTESTLLTVSSTESFLSPQCRYCVVDLPNQIVLDEHRPHIPGCNEDGSIL